VLRFLSISISALSLLLYVATVALWVRSYSHWDGLYRSPTADTTGITIMSAKGSFVLAIVGDKALSPWRPAEWSIESQDVRDINNDNIAWKQRILGFGWGKKPRSWDPSFLEYFLLLPDWVVLAISLATFLRLFPMHIHRKLASTCRQCHYNLTGNTSGVCPKCGTAIASKKRDTAPLWCGG
jgi:hypothetical protein